MTDSFTVRSVVVLLGIVAVVGLAFMGWLTLEDKSIPDAITATTSGSIGALSALLARTSVDDASGSSDSFGGGVG